MHFVIIIKSYDVCVSKIHKISQANSAFFHTEEFDYKLVHFSLFFF